MKAHLLHKIILATLILLLGGLTVRAQVKIAPPAEITANPQPDSSAMLEVTDTTRGVLIPRMTTAQRDNIFLPAHSLMIFNTDEKCLQLNLGTTVSPIWQCLASTDSVFADHDWYDLATSDIPADINNNIMTGGSVSIGDTATTRALGDYSIAVGLQDTASGSYSVAMGFANKATNNTSIALGNRNMVSGIAAFAVGRQDTVSANYATAFGHSNKVSGTYGVAGGMGQQCFRHGLFHPGKQQYRHLRLGRRFLD